MLHLEDAGWEFESHILHECTTAKVQKHSLGQKVPNVREANLDGSRRAEGVLDRPAIKNIKARTCWAITLPTDSVVTKRAMPGNMGSQ